MESLLEIEWDYFDCQIVEGTVGEWSQFEPLGVVEGADFGVVEGADLGVVEMAGFGVVGCRLEVGGVDIARELCLGFVEGVLKAEGTLTDLV